MAIDYAANEASIAAAQGTIQRYAGRPDIVARHEAFIGRTRQMMAETRRAEVENIRSVRAAVRQARIARATLVNQAGNSGVAANSSAVQGGAGSIQTQLGSNLSYFSDALRLGAESQAAQFQQTNAQVTLNHLAEQAAKKSNKFGRVLGIASLALSAYTGGVFGAVAGGVGALGKK